MKIVIRAGGIGTRLWPISRESKPKQFHALLSEKTMLQEAIERIMPITKPEDIYISTNVRCESIVRNELGAILENNLIIEPARRETTAAIGLESILIHKKDPQAIIASLGSDHAILRNNEFLRLLKLAEKTIHKHPHNIICLGIRPDYPDTGYGYIELADKINKDIYKVKSFHEKPDRKKAKKFLAKDNFLWNANMFVWRVDVILSLYKKHLPTMYKQLQVIAQAIGTTNEKGVIKRIYPKLEKIAIDYAIIEKINNILAIPASIGWNDIGDWARLKDQLANKEKDNVIKTESVNIDTQNTLIFSERKKLIATIGLKNLIIIDTDDALLICDKYRSADVKQIVEALKKKKKNNYLV